MMKEDYSEYIREQTDIIRNKINGMQRDITDREALEIIEEQIFATYGNINLSLKDIRQIIRDIYIKLRCKLGVIQELVDNELINEIMVNGAEKIFIEKGGKLVICDEQFESTEELEEVIRTIAAGVHREINEMNPIVDARLEDGSRVNGVYKNIALNGPILTIRKFGKTRITMKDLMRAGSMSEDCASMLKTLVAAGYNIFVSGGTSSGKTTFLNALSEFIPKGERVIVIEDSAELQMKHIDNLVQMECHNANSLGQGSVSMDMLIKTSLRMRPDRIIVGEVRGKEVSDMLQAMNTGHDGSMSTGHGNSVSGMLRRIEAMYLMSAKIPIDAIRAQIVEGIDIMVHLGRTSDGRRMVMEVAELLDYCDDKYILSTLFARDENMNMYCTGNKLVNTNKLRYRGIKDDRLQFLHRVKEGKNNLHPSDNRFDSDNVQCVL